MSDIQEWLKIERRFDAPIALVWRLWTDPELFKQWYGPKGMSVPVAEMDVTIGGIRKISMAMPGADASRVMWFTGVYKEINPPNRLVYTESMCDAEGTILSPQTMGMPDDFPDITEVIIDLTEAGSETRMVMVHVGVGEGTAGAGGWNQAFDKFGDLAANLAQTET